MLNRRDESDYKFNGFTIYVCCEQLFYRHLRWRHEERVLLGKEWATMEGFMWIIRWEGTHIVPWPGVTSVEVTNLCAQIEPVE